MPINKLIVGLVALLLLPSCFAQPPFEVLRSCIDEKSYNNQVTINIKDDGSYADNHEDNCEERFEVSFDNTMYGFVICADISYLVVNEHKINLQNAENRSVNPEIKPGMLYPTDTSWSKIDFKNQSYLCLNGPISRSGTGSNIGQYYIIENAFDKNITPIIYYYFFNKEITPITSEHL